jgi:hypothetical protein
VDRTLLEEIRRPRSRSDDPVAYGLGRALGPSGQMYLNGRLPGYRRPGPGPGPGFGPGPRESALPAPARLLGDMQQRLTVDDLARAIDDFAA